MTPGQIQDQRDRKQSASFSDDQPQRPNSVLALGLDALRSATALPHPQRRSSGGNSYQAAAPGATLGRMESARAAARALVPSTPSPLLPQFRTLDSYNARNVAAALDQGGDPRQIDDFWQQVCVRVLPLFNGEGIRGFVEDLNILVLNHVQRRFALAQSARQRAQANPSVNVSTLVTGLVIADLTDLIRTGLTTLAHKLAPSTPAQPLDNDRLLAGLNETWLFFFTGILPHLEAVFWVLRSDERLRAAVGREARPSREQEEGRIDIRRIALLEFRDEILHPEMARLVPILEGLYHGAHDGSEPDSHPASRRPSFSTGQAPPPPPDIRRAISHPHPPSRPISPVRNAPAQLPHPQPHRQYSSPPRLSPDPNYISSFPSPAPSAAPSPRFSSAALGTPSPAAAQAFARRRQMVAVLAALRTDDDRQSEMDALLRLIRPAPAPRRGARRRRASSASASRAAESEQPTGHSIPIVVASGAEGDEAEPGSGAATGLTGSPVQLSEEPSSLSSHGEGADLPPLPLPPPALAPLPHAIDARQRHRSRTMDSLDEEAVQPYHYQQAAPLPLPPRLVRSSSDGASIASVPAQQSSDPPPAIGGASAAAKKTRRRSFLPQFTRSNSNASTATSASGATGGSALDGGGGSDDDAHVLAALPAGAGGDKLRRGLLRRNSSRRAVELVGAGAAGPALGAAGGFAVEDDALDV